MKTLKTDMTAAQAARIETLAGALNMAPGDLLRTLALDNLDGWDDRADEFLENWGYARETYATRASRNDTDATPLEDAVVAHIASMFGTKSRKRAA